MVSDLDGGVRSFVVKWQCVASPWAVNREALALVLLCQELDYRMILSQALLAKHDD